MIFNRHKHFKLDPSNLLTSILSSRSKLKFSTFSLGLNLKTYQDLTMEGNNNPSCLNTCGLLQLDLHLSTYHHKF